MFPTAPTWLKNKKQSGYTGPPIPPLWWGLFWVLFSKTNTNKHQKKKTKKQRNGWVWVMGREELQNWRTGEDRGEGFG